MEISHNKHELGMSCGVVHTTPGSYQYFGDVQLCNLCGRYSPWGSAHTCPLTEAELREQIAQEIEAQIKDNEWAGAYTIAAAIARGRNDQ